ncbi:ABC transporter ATP-binding protein [Parafilimonas sp.]|uniref:ABC transporter ATP-binding protein n=1 Tax=Parafilimonas sp. TaxID=1969739 RepID=UPI0039E4223D
MKIEVKNISRKFGSNTVFAFLNLHIEGGTVYCLLGRNGAGKSTLLNIIANLLEPDEGDIIINDHLTFNNPNPLELKRAMGVQSQFDQVIGELNACDYLKFIGLLYKMKKDEIKQQTDNLLNYFFDEEENLSKAIQDYSSGMKRKIAICAAIIHKPSILILDEPFANLDPVASDKLCKLINAYINQERIILVSSHDLLYVDKIATHIGILDYGKLVFNDSLNVFKNSEKEGLDTNLLRYLKPKYKDIGLLI